MRLRLILAAMAVCLAASPGAAQVETYAPLPRVWHAGLSPDGSLLATGCSPRGQREICIYDLTGAEQTRLIASPEGGRITGFYWPSDDYLIYWVDSFQTLNTNTSALREFTSTRAISYSVERGTTAILLGDYASVTGLHEVTSSLVGRDDRVAMELTLVVDQRARAGSRFGDRRTAETVAYEVSLEDGDLIRPLETSQSSVIQFVLDAQGNAVLEIRYDDNRGDYSIHRTGRDRGEVFSANYLAALPRIYGFSDGGSAIAIHFPETGLRRLDIATGDISIYEVDGQALSGAAPIVDRVSRNVVGFAYRNDLPYQVFVDTQLAGLQAELEQILSETSVVIAAWSSDRSKLVVEARDIGVPANYYLLDLTTGALGLLDVELALSDDRPAGRRERVTFTASDGLEIDGWLTSPATTEAAGLPPLIVMPHGGPQSEDGGEFDWWAAHYASLGYAVLQPNFRGSSGRGSDFVEAGHGGFGTRMIDDVIEGAHALQAEGRVQPGPYCAVGGSYGGYAALMAALRDPEGVACVVSYAGVTHPFALLERGAGRSSTVRYWEAYMGSRFEDAAYRNSITPVLRAGEIGQPLLMLHGDEDTTVDYDQMVAMRRAMNGRADAHFVTLEGESHYLDTQASREILLRESGSFLSRHLPVE